MAAPKLVIALALAALAAVARADYMTVQYFTDATCTKKSSYAVQNGICAPDGNGKWTMAASCSAGNIKVYSAAGCTGTPTATLPFAQALGGAPSTCNTVQAGVLFQAIKYVNYVCVVSTDDPTAGNLPVGIATIAYTDSSCSTKFSAQIDQYCGSSSGISQINSCSITQSYAAYYGTSSTCTGTVTQTSSKAIKTTCSLDATSNLYTTESCITPTCTAGTSFSTCATCQCSPCRSPTPGTRVDTPCTPTSDAVILPCLPKTYSATGSSTNACTKCTDANAVSNAGFTACVCAPGFSATSAGADPTCASNSAPYKGYVSTNMFAGSSTCSGTATMTQMQNSFSSGCTKQGSVYYYTSCADSSTMLTTTFSDAACTVYLSSSSYPFTCSPMSGGGSSVQTCVMGTSFPATAPTPTGTSNVLTTHYSASAACSGATDTYVTISATYGACVVSGTESYSWSCKNSFPSRMDYTDNKCSVGGKSTGPTTACTADTGSGATGSIKYSCTGGTTSSSGAAATAAGVVAVVAAAAAAVALA